MIDTAVTTLLTAIMLQVNPNLKTKLPVALSTAVSPNVDPTLNPLSAWHEYELPRIAFTPLGGPRDYTDDGPVGIVKARYQIDLFFVDVVGARTLFARLMKPHNAATNPGLDGYQGTSEGTRIQRIYFPELPTLSAAGVRTQGSNIPVGRLSADMLIDHYHD